ncbi:DUF7144 family membrane protein [Janibacter alittae]|uniref:DUF7144 domain-containing protein n=1 Tax=Janibacter alittae TaxID=3115209 RepID=A0ABZ2MJM1_9MICO
MTQESRGGRTSAAPPSAWATGWTVFAGTILVLTGIFQIIAGIVAVGSGELYVVTNDWLFQFDVTTWGWIHLVLGVVLLLSGIGIFTGNVVARSIGVLIAGLSAIAAFMWLPYYPLWGVIIIALDVAVIWALTTRSSGS